jgi:hypothetical protein
MLGRYFRQPKTKKSKGKLRDVPIRNIKTEISAEENY